MKSGTPVLAVPASEPSSSAAKYGITALALLSTGHFFIDLYSAALGALQPLLVEKLRLTLTEAGMLGGVMILFNSVLQPAYGYLSDRLRTRAFATLTPGLAGIFICCLGLAPSFPVLLALVVVGGSAIAAFHPQGSALVTRSAVSHPGRDMSIFISAGTLGMAIGPAYFTAVVGTFGLERGWWAAIPGVLATIALICYLPEGSTNSTRKSRGSVDWAELKAVRRPLLVLYFLVFIRSIVGVTYGQFLPLYLVRDRGFPVDQANYVLSIYFAFGALGGFVGGHLADRFGGRRIILLSMAGSVPLLSIFFAASGWLSLAGLTLGGLVLLFTIPVNVVMAQQLAPRQAGTVSALLMGFAWGMAGLIFVPLTGWAADRIGMHLALASLLVFPVFGWALGLLLPKEDAR